MDKCPKCGAETKYHYVSIGGMAVNRQFECGSRLFNDGVIICSEKCQDRQIAALTAALEAKSQALREAEEKLALWREHWKIVDSHYITEAYDYSDKGKEKELRAKGEIGGQNG